MSKHIAPPRSTYGEENNHVIRPQYRSKNQGATDSANSQSQPRLALGQLPTEQNRPILVENNRLKNNENKIPVYVEPHPKESQSQDHDSDDTEDSIEFEELEDDFGELDQDLLDSDQQPQSLHSTDSEVEESIRSFTQHRHTLQSSTTGDTTTTAPTANSGSVVPLLPVWDSRIHHELTYVNSKFQRDSPDEDDEDTYDVTMVAEYAPDIFRYMRQLEARLSPNPRYMDSQNELEWHMRRTLVDWLVQVHSRFNLLPETLFLTVNYIDRFLSKRTVSASRFQLVGLVALFIAAKYEEINCPSIQEVASLINNAYSIDDLLRAEKFMIDILEFEMGWPGPMSFLRRTSKADDYDFDTRTLAKYFLEITIMDSKLVASPPSWLAAGAHYLARRLLNRGSWTDAHIFYSGYTEEQLTPLADMMVQMCRHPLRHHRTIFEKYSERRYKRSAEFVQEWMQK
ncbi:hypothetical protein LJB42_003315 [Komagataella kurtzmanii]|nr:hypothetical protein LJB42_003315 [Komagataella kurtzmanii]